MASQANYDWIPVNKNDLNCLCGTRLIRSGVISRSSALNRCESFPEGRRYILTRSVSGASWRLSAAAFATCLAAIWLQRNSETEQPSLLSCHGQL